MKFIEHCTSELIQEDKSLAHLNIGDSFFITENTEIFNLLRCQVREIAGDECRVDILEGDLIEVDNEDRVVTVGVLPEGHYVTRDDDGDWVLVPPRNVTIFSAPGEAVLLATMSDSKKDAVRDAVKYLAGEVA